MFTCTNTFPVPDYLRTKLDLDLESQEQQLEAEAAKLSTEMAQEHVTSLNEKVRQMLEMISEYKDNWEDRSRPIS
jgi:D-mannonate dehydratase